VLNIVDERDLVRHRFKNNGRAPVLPRPDRRRLDLRRADGTIP
jgi:hypothetical protein